MSTPDPIAHLVPHPEELPPELLAELVALGSREIEQMIAHVADPRSDDEVILVGAVTILGMARISVAIPALVRRMALCDEDDVDLVYPRVVRALGRMHGPDLVEPLLGAALDGHRAIDATMLLASCGVRDDRIRARIADLIRADVELGTDAVLECRDLALVPDLQAALDRLLEAGVLRFEAADQALAIVKAFAKLGVVDEPRTIAVTAAMERAASRMQERVRRMEEDLQVARSARAMRGRGSADA